MKHILVLLASTALVAFANSNAASKFYVSSAAVGNTNLAQGDYEALTWVQVGSVGSRGEMGKITNILTYNTWDTTVAQKAKGVTDAGSAELEVARIPTDAGQIILRAAGAVGNNQNYAFKEVRADGMGSNSGTIIYNRGLVGGPKRPGGRNEDFDLEVFTLALQQEEVVVNPLTSGNPPEMTVAPAITGTATVGQVLTLGNGTFTGDATITYTYQWFRGGVAIAGATAATYTLVTADSGHKMTGRVFAQNLVGSAYGFSAATAAVS
jgi:hypothetical protein